MPQKAYKNIERFVILDHDNGNFYTVETEKELLDWVKRNGTTGISIFKGKQYKMTYSVEIM